MCAPGPACHVVCGLLFDTGAKLFRLGAQRAVYFVWPLKRGASCSETNQSKFKDGVRGRHVGADAAPPASRAKHARFRQGLEREITVRTLLLLRAREEVRERRRARPARRDM